MKNDIFRLLEENRGICLNDQQKAAALHYKGPGAVLAVPGSGKTTVLMTRTANLIMNHGIKPQHILTITFNRAAVYDMQQRFHSIFGKDLPQMNFSTIHAFALSVLKCHFYKNGQRINIIEGNKSNVNKNVILKGLYRDINGELPGEDKLEELSRAIGFVKNMMLTEAERKSLDVKVEGFEDIYIKYEKFKKQKNLIDFDDMLTQAYSILSQDSRLLSECRRSYPFVQVDEFQDNSKIQNELIRLVASPQNNLFVVADDDQCIYGFRGACPQAVLSFKDDYPGAETFFMEENFRSCKDIVEFSNRIIKSNHFRYDKSMYTQRKQKGKVQLVRPKDEDGQLDMVMKAVRTAPNLGQVAVLFRNNLSAVTLADRLARESIPFYIKDKSLHFFKHWVTEDMLSFLRLSINPGDMESFRRIYYKCGCFVSKEAVEEAASSSSKSVFEALRCSSSILPYARKRIGELESSIKGLSYKTPYLALECIEGEIGYGDYIIDNGPKRGYAVDSLMSIMESLKIIASHTRTITEFMARLDVLQEAIRLASDNKNDAAVTLSTLHSSKGLEFDRVYIIDASEGIFPPQGVVDAMDKGDTMAMEEERRLFYVGMTRAREMLTISSPQMRNNGFSDPSAFVLELYNIIGGNGDGERGSISGE